MTPRLSGSPSKQVMVRMTPEMHEAIKAAAEEDGRTMAQQVRYAVRLHLEGRGDKKLTLICRESVDR